MLPADLEALRSRPIFTTSDLEIIDELPIHTLVTDSYGYYYIKCTTMEYEDPMMKYFDPAPRLETYWMDIYEAEYTEIPDTDLDLPITVRYMPPED